MRKAIGWMFVLAGSAVVALAQVQGPEIDPTSVASGLTLLGGIVLIVRGRRR